MNAGTLFRLAAFAIVIVIAGFVLARPAAAQVAQAVPEPTDLALFALGVVGVIVGHHSSRKRPPRD